MPLNASLLAEEIREALGKKPPTSSQTKGLARAIVNEITSLALITFPPGPPGPLETVSGTAPSGGPILRGSAKNGVIAGPTPATLGPRMVSEMGVPPTPQTLALANAIATHLLTSGRISFPAGTVTGGCSNSAVSPGAFTGAGAKGLVGGLTGSGLSSLLGSAFGGVSKELQKMCDAIVKHIQKNGVASVPPAGFTAVAPAGGGPITGGAGAGGKIS